MKRLFFLALAFVAISCQGQVTIAQTQGVQTHQTSRRARATLGQSSSSAAEELMLRSRQLKSTDQAGSLQGKRRPRVATIPFRRAPQQQVEQSTPKSFQQSAQRLPSQADNRALTTNAARLKTPVQRPPMQMNDELPTSVEDQITGSVSVVGTDIIAPPGINVGQESQFTAVVNNLGEQSISQVVMRLQLPTHLQFVRSVPSPFGQEANLLEFRINSLAAQSRSEIVLTVVPNEKLPIRITAETQVVNQDQIEIAVQKPEIHIEAQATPQAIVGDTIHHVIRITNTGDGIADDLQLKMVLPADMVALVEQEEQFVGDLAPGMTRELIFETRSSSSGAAAVEYLVSGKNILAKDRTEIAVVWPELHVELLGPKINIIDRPGDYTIRLTNPCEITINSTKVSLEIPAGLEVTTLSREGQYNGQLRTIEWDLASMQPGAEETIQFRAHLIENAAQICQVTVESVETQANQLALETKPYSHTALKVAMRNKTGAIVVGDTAEFEIIATNEGSTNAENVVLEVEIPSWMEPVPNSRYQVDREKSVIRFLPQEIAMASQKELTFEATCNKAGNYVLRSMLQHSSQSRPLISDASLFILDGQQEKIGGIVSPEKVLR